MMKYVRRLRHVDNPLLIRGNGRSKRTFDGELKIRGQGNAFWRPATVRIPLYEFGSTRD